MYLEEVEYVVSLSPSPQFEPQRIDSLNEIG